MPLVIAVLLGLAGLAIIIFPLLGLDRETAEAEAGGPIAEVAERERLARDALREVEFDHRLGNLDDNDYQALRARYERRALAALKARYQREQELDALIEQQLDALRAQPDAINDDAAAGAGAEPVSPATPRFPSGKSGGQNGHATDSDPANRTNHNGARPANGPQARRRRGGHA